MHKDFAISAKDGLKLNASLFETDNSSDSVIVIASAMAVHRHLYKKYATYLAENGFKVITFDYRGTNGDTQKAPSSISMRDWATYDIAGVLDWVTSELNPKKLFVVSQSAGGQLLGLTPNNHLVDGMIAITSQSGYWGHWSGKEKCQVWLLWHIFIPLFCAFLPVFPGKLFGMGENIPAGVAKQWARWGRHPEYITSDPGPQYFAHFKAPIRFYSFSDDLLFGPERSVKAITEFYPNAQVEWKHISPEDLGEKRVGHFGFFKEKMKGRLWKETLDWLKALE